jgi:hypothetical protein
VPRPPLPVVRTCERGHLIYTRHAADLSNGFVLPACFVLVTHVAWAPPVVNYKAKRVKGRRKIQVTLPCGKRLKRLRTGEVWDAIKAAYYLGGHEAAEAMVRLHNIAKAPKDW